MITIVNLEVREESFYGDPPPFAVLLEREVYEATKPWQHGGQTPLKMAFLANHTAASVWDDIGHMSLDQPTFWRGPVHLVSCAWRAVLNRIYLQPESTLTAHTRTIFKIYPAPQVIMLALKLEDSALSRWDRLRLGKTLL